MKSKLKFFAAAFAVAVVFLSVSCNRSTSASVTTEAVSVENANIEQEEAQTIIYEVEDEGTSDSIDITENTITRFPPLQDNERFAHSTTSERRNPATPTIFTPILTLYAASDNNDIEDASVLFTWDNATDRIQFSGDRRMAFFVVRNIVPGLMPSWNLYAAIGSTGEIKRLTTDMGYPIHRASEDGIFALHLSVTNRVYRNSINLMNFYLVNVENGAILDEFEWQLNRSEFLHEIDPIEGLNIHWSNGIFRLIAVGYRGAITAEAEYDPETMELRTLFIR